MRESFSSIPSFFEEDAYLFYNPDIAAAVEGGKIPSGYHHWIHDGYRELRGGAPVVRARAPTLTEAKAARAIADWRRRRLGDGRPQKPELPIEAIKGAIRSR